MIDIAGLLTGIGGLVNAGSGIASTVLGYNSLAEQKRVNEQNYQAQLDALAWQKEMQQTAWNREDTAVQRRVADLKAAGLNPVLAAGSAAQSSSPMHLNAPQREVANPAAAQQALAQMGNIAQTVGSLAAVNAQIKKTQAETENINFQNAMNDREKMILFWSDLLRDEQNRGGTEREANLRNRERLTKLGAMAAQTASTSAQADSANYILQLSKGRGVMPHSSVHEAADLYAFAGKEGGTNAMALDTLMKIITGLAGGATRKLFQ